MNTELVGGYLEKHESGQLKKLYVEINSKAKILGIKVNKADTEYLRIYSFHELKKFVPIIVQDQDPGKANYIFELQTVKKNYLFQADDQDSYQFWVDTLKGILGETVEKPEEHFTESEIEGPMIKYGLDEYPEIIKRARELAHHRMAYPRAEMHALYTKKNDEGKLEFTLNETEGPKFIDNAILGIDNGGFLDYTNIQVGDPWAERKNHPTINHIEKEIIQAMAAYLGAEPDKMKGYICSGGTEGNMAGMWWSIRYLNQLNSEKIIQLEEELSKLSASDDPLSSMPLETELKILRLKKHIEDLRKPIVYFTYLHTHYSIKKICELFNTEFIEIEGDQNGEMELEQFKAEIAIHAKKFPHRGVIVFANVGTTMYGGIDNIPEINKILTESGLSFTIHADAALMGPTLPIIQPFGPHVKNYFDDVGINTMAISGHKFFGVSNVCGIALARKELFKVAFSKGCTIGYVGDIHDSTIAGSRSGLNVVLLHHVILSLGLENGNEMIKMIVENNLRNAEYAYKQLVEILGAENVHWKADSFAIVIKKPKEEIMKKYSLMPVFEDKAGLEILQHVVREKIDSFLEDLRKM